MKMKPAFRFLLLLAAFVLAGWRADAQFILIDNFSNSVTGHLQGQASDGPSNAVWSAKTSAACVIITNSSTPGVGLPGSGTPLTPNAAMVTTSDGVAYIPLPVTLQTNNRQATVFLQFDMGPAQTANDVNWDLANSVGSDGGGSQNQIELNANVPSRAGLTINNGPVGGGKNFVELSADGVHVFTPLNSTVYNIWFVICDASNNFVIYMQDASPNGTDLPNLTRMEVATAGGNTPTTFTTAPIGYRAAGLTPMTYFAFGPGGNDNVATGQFLYSVYEDPSSMDLTNPVTGLAPVSLAPPTISAQPQSVEAFPGATVAFTVGAAGGSLHYQWESNGVPMTDGGNISGSGTNALTITGVSAASAASYSCVITNSNTGAYRSTNSAAATLAFVTPGGTFESAMAAAGALHFYAFDDLGNPATGTEAAFDYEGGDNGIYGASSENGYDGIAGPRPVEDGLSGFSESNYALEVSPYNEPQHVTVNSPWNLNTNAVTLTAWINPNGAQDNLEGIVFNRGSGSDVAGLNISSSGNSTLGYTWNNDSATFGWDSTLQPPPNQWSFVALVITATNATIHLMNTNGIFSSTHVYAHPSEAFGGTTMIGDDSGTTTGARTFSGSIDEVGVFNQALTRSQLQGMFTNASGVVNFGPTNWVNLVTTGVIYPAQSAQFTSVNGGQDPLYYTWQLNGANLVDGAGSVGTIIGSATPFLTISNLTPITAGQTYALTLVTSNSSGSYTSSVPAYLSVQAPGSPTTIYTLGMEASGLDWNTGTNWSDGNPASYSVISTPDSTYQIGVSPNTGIGTVERSPASTNAAFPGSVLQILGSGVLVDGGGSTFATNTITGELRLKASGNASLTNYGTVYAYAGTVYFPDLQLVGGQLDNANAGEVTLNGELDVLTNSVVYADSAAAGSIRPIQINSFLTGTGTLTYGYLATTGAATNDLIVSGATNTFSGQWNVLQGTLLGTAPNALGTNIITIGTNGALETTYNINNPAGDLFLNGRMFLYTNDIFNSVVVDGVSLTNGTYTSAQLNSLFPENFPTNWNVQIGSMTGTNTGVGSLTVLTTLTPAINQQPVDLTLYPGQTAQFTATAFGALSYQWWFTNQSGTGVQLANGGGITGAQGLALTISSVTAANAGTYTLTAANTAGATNTVSATLTILPVSPPADITMSAVESLDQDWNTGTNWSDDLPASVSIYAAPGSTYTVLPGAVLRTPATATNSAFPGATLVVDSSGELLLENPAARNLAFPDLQLIGGSMDNGADGLATLTGELDISNSVTIYSDSNAPAGFVVNFDTPGGVGGVNYNAAGACPDPVAGSYWNPVPGTSGTSASATNSDGATISGITLTVNTGATATGTYYGSYDNSAGTVTNTPAALEDNYLYVGDNLVPNFALGAITDTLNNVPPGTYNLYLYGNNGGHSGGYLGLGDQNNWGTIFSVSSDLTPASSLSTANGNVSYTSGHFIQGVDYVVFSNVVVGAGGAIAFTWTGNTNVNASGGENYFGAFNGLQLATVVPAAVGPRPYKINSLLTGNGVINYQAGDTNFASDLDINGAANAFSGPWNVVQGTLLGGAAGALGTNSITVGTAGALETLYNLNDTNAGLVLNGRMFLHASDTVGTLSVNGVPVAPGTYTFAQLHSAYPANFPATWPLQANSSVSSGSGQITVLASAGGSSTTTLMLTQSGANLTLTWASGGTLQMATNLPGPWTTVAGATSPYQVMVTNAPAQFFRVHP